MLSWLIYYTLVLTVRQRSTKNYALCVTDQLMGPRNGMAIIRCGITTKAWKSQVKITKVCIVSFISKKNKIRHIMEARGVYVRYKGVMNYKLP